MNFTELLQHCPEVNITIKGQDLKDLIQEVKEDTAKQIREAERRNREEVFYTPDEVCELLKVSKTTLWQWEKKDGILVSIAIGGARRYRLSDIQKFTSTYNL